MPEVMPKVPTAAELLNAKFLAAMKKFNLAEAEKIFSKCETEGLKWQEVFKAGGAPDIIGKGNIVNGQEDPFAGLKRSEKEFRAEVDAFLGKILDKLGDDIGAINASGIIILASWYGAQTTFNTLMKKEGLDLEVKVNRNETALTAALSLAYLAQDEESKEFGKKATEQLLAKGARSYAAEEEGHSCLNLIITNSIADGIKYEQTHKCEAGEYKQFLDSITAVPLQKEEIEDGKTFEAFKDFLKQAFTKSRGTYLKEIYDKIADEMVKNPGKDISEINFGRLINFDPQMSKILINGAFHTVENELKKKELQKIYEEHIEQIKSDYLSMEKLRQQVPAEYRYGGKIQEIIADYLLLEQLRQQVRADFRCGEEIQKLIDNPETDLVTKKLLETLQLDIQAGQQTLFARVCQIVPNFIMDLFVDKPDFAKIDEFTQNIKNTASKGDSKNKPEGKDQNKSWVKEVGEEREAEKSKERTL